MSFKHGMPDDPYPKEKTFTKEELLELTPSDIRRWLCLRCFNDPDPNEDDKPLNCRADSLRKARQAVSQHMPNKTKVA